MADTVEEGTRKVGTHGRTAAKKQSIRHLLQLDYLKSHQREFRKLVCDYIGRCRRRSATQRCDRTDAIQHTRVRCSRFGQKKTYLTKCRVFGSQKQLPKTSRRGRPATIWNQKSSETGMFGRPSEIANRKMRTTLWRENDSELKLVEKWHDRGTF